MWATLIGDGYYGVMWIPHWNISFWKPRRGAQVTGVFVERSTSMRLMDEENMMSGAQLDSKTQVSQGGWLTYELIDVCYCNPVLHNWGKKQTYVPQTERMPFITRVSGWTLGEGNGERERERERDGDGERYKDSLLDYGFWCFWGGSFISGWRDFIQATDVRGYNQQECWYSIKRLNIA